MTKKISSDKSVSKETEDEFQRYDFSKQIASKIASSEDNDSIVIGLYGKWGEGKTSVLNFIETELQDKNNIISVKFNPWRFTEESVLLTSFFNTLASEVIKYENINTQKKQKSSFWFKNILKTKRENIGDVISEYGKIVSFIGAGETAETIGKIFSKVDIEILKKRFENLLIESRKKLVIFIDDIDRLDKEELHSIFRLVKLTADFSNTYYILAFDDEMVASAIGERYGKGDALSGHNFLEKIIQVPLKIPLAQTEDLKQFCFKQINKALDEYAVNVSQTDSERFIYQFTTNIQLRLQTPRLAIRYGNSLSFSLPLLIGEVNIVDLMLIEALKVFYPDHYNLVKNNPDLFLKTYIGQRNYDIDDAEGRKNELEAKLDELSVKLTIQEIKAAKNLLKAMFPYLKEAFENYSMGNYPPIWFKDKRIASPHYFDKYFLYTIPRGEISDVLLSDFMKNIPNYSYDEIIKKIQVFIEKGSINNFLHKLRTFEEELDWGLTQKLTKSIVLNNSLFPENTGIFSFLDSPNTQVAIFISQLLRYHSNIDEAFELAKQLVTISNPLEFNFELFRWFSSGKSEDEKIFSLTQYHEISRMIRERCLKEAGDISLFEKYSDQSFNLFRSWNESDPLAMKKYIKGILDKEPKKVIDLLYAFTPTIRSSNEPAPFKVDFDKDNYLFFIGLFDENYIYNLIQQEYSKDLTQEKVKFFDREKGQTKINILRQFLNWYEEKQ